MKLSALQSALGAELPEVFDVAKERGFDGVELDWRELEQIHGGTLSPEDRPRWLGAAQNAGVAISGVIAHFLSDGGVSHADEKHRERGLWAMREGLQLCRDLQSETLIVPFFDSAALQSEEDKQRLVQNLKILAPEAKEAGVVIAIGHTLSSEQAARLLDDVDSPFIGACLHLSGEATQEEIARLKHHLARVYIEGKASHETLAALITAGYTGYLTLQTGAVEDEIQLFKATIAK